MQSKWSMDHTIAQNAEKNYCKFLADLKNKKVYACCKCGLEWPLVYAPVFQPIDYYNKFRDAWKKQSYGIIKQK